MGANGASCQELQIAPKNRFHTIFFEKVMDLSLLIFTLETYQFCMKCIEFTTRTYNFKNLAVGSLIWSAKTEVNSSHFPQKIRTCPVLCCILTLLARLSRRKTRRLGKDVCKTRRLGLRGASVNENKYIYFLVDLVAHFLKLYVDYMRKWSVAMKIEPSEIGFQLVTFSKNYFDLYFYAWIVANRVARRVDQALVQGLFAKTKVFMAYCNLLRVQ